MNPRRRLAVAAAGGALAAGSLLVALPGAVHAEQIGGDPQWEGTWSEPIEHGYEFTGDRMVLSGTIAYTGPPGSEITDLDLIVDWRETTAPAGCEGADNLAYSEHRDLVPDDPDDEGEELPDPESAGPAPATVDFTFTVTPRCNGAYRVEVVATADNGGPGEPDESPAWVLDDIKVSLRPPPATSLEAVLQADRTVALAWTPPEGYAPGSSSEATTSGVGPPPDFLGYIVERAGPGATTWERIGLLRPTQLRHVDATLPPQSTFGEHRYRVLTARAPASGEGALISAADAAPVATADFGPAPTTATSSPSSATTNRPSPRPTGGSRTPGTAPSEDDFFDEELDYDDFEPGFEDPVLPEDATGLLSVGSDTPGQGLTVPFASAMVLGVWAMHLRYLSRRAAQAG